MSFNYADMQGTATSLVTYFGQTLTFTRSTEGTYSAATLSATETASTFTGIGVEANYRTMEIDGTRIISGDKKLIMNAMTTAPAEGDIVAVNSTDYRVMSVMAKNPAGTIITYELQVRV